MNTQRAGSIALTLALLWMAALTPSTSVLAADNDGSLWQIIPGLKVGPITAKTTAADLVRVYGRGNVQHKQIDVGEGQLEPGTVIYPGDPMKTAEIVWNDAAQKRFPKMVIIHGAHSLWKTSQGITLGTTLKELEKLNGRPFTLSGFDWDYSGTVFSWEHGRLAKPFETGMVLRLEPPDDVVARGIVSQTEYESVLGDRTLRSDQRAMQKINPRVYEIQVLFP